MSGPSDTLPCGSPGLRDWKGDRRGTSPDAGRCFPEGALWGFGPPTLAPHDLFARKPPALKSSAQGSLSTVGHGPRLGCPECARTAAGAANPARCGAQPPGGRQQLPPNPQNQKPLRYLLLTACGDRKWKHVHLLYLVQPLFSRQTGKSWPSPLQISPNRAGPAGP